MPSQPTSPTAAAAASGPCGKEPAQQTFVFADLAGYTLLTERLGDEAAADLAVAFCEQINTLLPVGAEDLKSLGDACMLRIPDAEQAVRFGLALAESAPALGPSVRARIGMHTGTAVQRRGDWYGAHVNLAARVAEFAGPDEVLLTHPTAEQLAGSGLRLLDRGIVKLRHISDPPRLYRVQHQPKPVSGRRAIGVL